MIVYGKHTPIKEIEHILLQMMKPQFKPINESDLAKKIGVSRLIIKDHRNHSLKEGNDWEKKGRTIVYTQQGAERLMNILGVNPPENELTTLHKADSDSGREELVFVRGGFTNDRVIQAKRESGELVTVRVRTSKNFRPTDAKGEPMRFPAVRDGAAWRIARALPRWPGKW